jgi:aquaporin Z
MIGPLVAELVGTMILNTVVCITLDATWSNGQQNFYDPYAVGMALWVAMIVTGFVSGGHFNPAVTVAVILKVLIDRSLNRALLFKYLAYIPVQIVGAYLGATLAYMMTNKTNFIDPASDSSHGASFLAETFFTFLLCSTALVSGFISKNVVVSGASVAAVLFAAASTIGGLSGACLNPAVGIGANTVALKAHPNSCDHLWIYIFAPLIGGGISALVYWIFKRDLDLITEAKSDEYRLQAN